MTMLALSWADSFTIVGVVAAIGFVLVVIGDAIFSKRKDAPALPSARLDELEDDLLAIRSDLADIKASLAELDRLFKSVG